jgi:hypothetical protein
MVNKEFDLNNRRLAAISRLLIGLRHSADRTAEPVGRRHPAQCRSRGAEPEVGARPTMPPLATASEVEQAR